MVSDKNLNEYDHANSEDLDNKTNENLEIASDCL